jgi:heterodisulfide reductase subunit A-like polyferredoxin
MNNYELYIKSHAEAPDFDQIIEAQSIGEATEHFYEILQGEFSRDFIRSNIQEV